MKTNSLFLIACLAPLTTSAEVFISEYVEGGGHNKAVEIYNPDENPIDLSTYQLKLFQNGGSSAQYTIDLSGTLASGDVYVVAHNQITDDSNVDLLVSNLLHNGDDAIVLYNDGVVVDSFGQVGTDPGSQWGSGSISTKDHSLVRLSSIGLGDIIINDAFEPSDQWVSFAKDTLSGLGAHTYDDAPDGGGDGGGDDGGGDDTPPVDGDATCGSEFTPIHTIQGSSTSSPLEGNQIWVEGIVTLDLQDSGYQGYYIQTPDNARDTDPLTSEGLFVYDTTVDVNAGDHVRIQATVGEYYGLTQLSSQTSVSICGAEVQLPAVTTLPMPSSEAEREAYEGMLVTFEQPLVVTDTYNYGRYGQLGLATERLFNPTQVTTPGPLAQALSAENAAKSIIIDDKETQQNPDFLPFPAPELDANNTVRSGDSMSNIVAVLSYAFGDYQLLPVNQVDVLPTNPRSASPEAISEGNVRVASFNVLNYFNGDGLGNGYPTPRGAETSEEFTRQRAKIIAAISALDADIIGLMEIENDGYSATSAIADLVNGLNDMTAEGTYQFVTPPVSTIGTDEIAVGLIYKQGIVSPLNAAVILNSTNSAQDESNQPLFLDDKNRPMLAQEFSLESNGETLVVAVNHLKSKGSSCDSLSDPDTNDGQGNCNITRTRAADAIGQFLAATYADTPTLVIGDLNAYAKEDPLTTLADQGYSDVFTHLNKTGVYSYIFSGELGQLDHALANENMAEQIVDATIWALNADEPRVLDYSTQYQSELQHQKFYAPDAFRSSDHDPIIVEIDLAGAALFGDFDNDQDIDKDDIKLFYLELNRNLITDMAFDFNKDNILNTRDVRGLMALCTRSRCATE